MHQEASRLATRIVEHDERFLRHLSATRLHQGTILPTFVAPFGVKSLRNDRTNSGQKTPDGNNGERQCNARVLLYALELRIIDIDNLHADEE